MYQIAYIGRWETLPETAAAICDYDTSKLEVLLQGGLDLDVPIQLSEYIKLMPLEIAVFRNDVPMIQLIPVWQRNSPCCSLPPAVVGRRWWRSLLDRPQNSARSRKSGPSRKCAGAIVRRISWC